MTGRIAAGARQAIPWTEPSGHPSTMLTVALDRPLDEATRALLAQEAALAQATPTRGAITILGLAIEPTRVLVRLGSLAPGAHRLDEILGPGPIPYVGVRGFVDALAAALFELTQLPDLTNRPRMPSRVGAASVVIEPTGFVRLLGVGLPLLDELLAPGLAAPNEPAGPWTVSFGLVRASAEMLFGIAAAAALSSGEQVPMPSPAVAEVFHRGLHPDLRARFPDVTAAYGALSTMLGPAVAVDLPTALRSRGLDVQRAGFEVFRSTRGPLDAPTTRLTVGGASQAWAPLTAAPTPEVSNPSPMAPAPMAVVAAPPPLPSAPMPTGAAPGWSPLPAAPPVAKAASPEPPTARVSVPPKEAWSAVLEPTPQVISPRSEPPPPKARTSEIETDRIVADLAMPAPKSAGEVSAKAPVQPVKAPEISIDAKAPEAKETEAKATEAKAPESKAPEGKAPEAKAPDTTAAPSGSEAKPKLALPTASGPAPLILPKMGAGPARMRAAKPPVDPVAKWASTFGAVVAVLLIAFGIRQYLMPSSARERQLRELPRFATIQASGKSKTADEEVVKKRRSESEPTSRRVESEGTREAEPLRSTRAAHMIHQGTAPAQAPDRLFMLQSNPPGAEVSVNGHLLGVSPMLKSLPELVPGAQIEVSISHRGYRTWTRRITVPDSGTVDLTAALDRI